MTCSARNKLVKKSNKELTDVRVPTYNAMVRITYHSCSSLSKNIII